jgi:hypothetical protein
MQNSKKITYDKRLTGFTIGIIFPIIVLVLFYLYRNPQSFSLFYEQMLSINIISRLVSLCVIPNLLVFFIFIWTNRYKSAYGVIGATFIYALVVLILTQV